MLIYNFFIPGNFFSDTPADHRSISSGCLYNVEYKYAVSFCSKGTRSSKVLALPKPHHSR